MMPRYQPGTKLYHLTDNPKFALDANCAPVDNSISIYARDGQKGIYLCSDPEVWVNGYNYVRPYLAEFAADPALESADGVHGRWGGELFVPAKHYDKLYLVRVIPLDAYVREYYGAHGWIEDHHSTTFDTDQPIARHPGNGLPVSSFRNYRYDGPDVRDMSEADTARHRARWVVYMKRNRGIDVDAVNDVEEDD